MADDSRTYSRFQRFLFPVLVAILLIGAAVAGLSYWRGQPIEGEDGADVDPTSAPAAEAAQEQAAEPESAAP